MCDYVFFVVCLVGGYVNLCVDLCCMILVIDDVDVVIFVDVDVVGFFCVGDGCGLWCQYVYWFVVEFVVWVLWCMLMVCDEVVVIFGFVVGLQVIVCCFVMGFENQVFVILWVI